MPELWQIIAVAVCGVVYVAGVVHAVRKGWRRHGD